MTSDRMASRGVYAPLDVMNFSARLPTLFNVTRNLQLPIKLTHNALDSLAVLSHSGSKLLHASPKRLRYLQEKVSSTGTDLRLHRWCMSGGFLEENSYEIADTPKD